MFCNNCGEKNMEGSKFCRACGKPLDIGVAANQSNPGAQPNPGVQSYPGTQPNPGARPYPGAQPNPGMQSYTGAQPSLGVRPYPGVPINAGVQTPQSNAGISNNVLLQQRNGRNKKVGIIAFAAVLAVILFAAVAIFGGGDSPAKVTEKYLTALCEDMDLKKALKYSAFNYKNLIEQMTEEDGGEFFDYYGIDSISDLYELYDGQKESLSNAYGEDYKITIKVYDAVELSEREMKEVIEQIEYSLEDLNIQSIIATDKINKMCELDVEMTISGKNDEDSNTITIMCAKIGRIWYVMDQSLVGPFM